MKFAKGHSKVLMKNEQASALDVAREKVLEKYALMLQRLARGFIVRRRLLFMRKVLQGLHDAIAKRSDTLLAKWFAQVRKRQESRAWERTDWTPCSWMGCMHVGVGEGALGGCLQAFRLSSFTGFCRESRTMRVQLMGGQCRQLLLVTTGGSGITRTRARRLPCDVFIRESRAPPPGARCCTWTRPVVSYDTVC